jgi:hypothetical protein
MKRGTQFFGDLVEEMVLLKEEKSELRMLHKVQQRKLDDLLTFEGCGK